MIIKTINNYLIFLISALALISFEANSDDRFVNHRDNATNIIDNLSNLNPKHIRALSSKSYLYLVNIDGEDFLTDHQGNFLIDFKDYFEIFDKGKIINIPRNRFLNEVSYSIINSINKDRLIHYETEEKLDFVFVIMDYTCPFCQQFHRNIKDDFLDNGVDVFYIPFRRSDEKLLFENNVNVFCQKDNSEKIKLYDNLITNSNTQDIINKECKYNKYYEFIENSLISINPQRVTPVVIGSNGITVEGLRDFNDYKNIIGINLHENN